MAHAQNHSRDRADAVRRSGRRGEGREDPRPRREGEGEGRLGEGEDQRQDEGSYPLGESMSARGLVVAAGALALWAACKKTVEGESKAWTRGVERVQSLATLYPGFAPALTAQRQRAEEAMKAADGVSNAEEKAKKMGEANNLL